jgi:hypothetical protein
MADFLDTIKKFQNMLQAQNGYLVPIQYFAKNHPNLLPKSQAANYP